MSREEDTNRGQSTVVANINEYCVWTPVMKSRIRDLRPTKNSKGRCHLFISSVFASVGVPRPNPLVEADAVRQYIVSCCHGAPRRSSAR